MFEEGDEMVAEEGVGGGGGRVWEDEDEFVGAKMI